MYTSFYNFSELPFTISTDPRFLWLGEKHLEALANLKYGLLEANGYVVLTGDVGVGKTTLVNALLDSVDDSVLTVNISHPTLSTMEFFRFLVKTWKGPAELADKTEFIFFIREFLLKTQAEGKTVLLIIDEAHRLSEELLEEIRLLSNMEHRGVRLINIFFVGQNELKEILMNPQFRALRQRITLFYDINPLSPRETAEYIRHRLQIAGGNTNLFSQEAVSSIHEFTRGYPRLINILCGRAMLTGYIKDKHKIDAVVVAECRKELDYLDPVMPRQANAAGRAAEMPIPAHVSPPSEPHVAPVVSLQKESRPERSPKTLMKRVVTVEKIQEMLQSKTEFFGCWRRWLPLSSDRKRVFVIVALAGIFCLYLFSDRNGSFANLETENEKIEGMTVSQDISLSGEEPGPTKETSYPSETLAAEEEQSEMAAAPPAPTTLELASAALKKERYQTVIDLLEAENNHPDKQSSDSVRQLYASALVGKAEQLISASPDEAKTLLRQAVEVDNANSRVYFLLGKLYTRNKEYAQAIDSFQTAGSLNPDFADSFFNLGFLYAKTGMYEKSEQFFQRAVELEPDYLGKALFNLAVVQDRLGKHEASVANLRRASQLNPENPKVKSYLQRTVAIGKGWQ